MSQYTYSIEIHFRGITLLTGNLFSEEERKILLHYSTTVLSTLRSTSVQAAKTLLKKVIFDEATYERHTQENRASLIKAVIHALFLQQVLIRYPELALLPTEEQVYTWIFESNPALARSRKNLLAKLHGDMRNLQKFALAVKTLHYVGLEGKNNDTVSVFRQVGAMLEGTGRVYATGGSPGFLTKCRTAIVQTITGYTGRVGKGRSSPRRSSSVMVAPLMNDVIPTPAYVTQEPTRDLDRLVGINVSSVVMSSADSVSLVSDADSLHDFLLNFLDETMNR